MNDAPRLDLLEILADHLEKNVKPETFDMGIWSREDECGTVACAIGHACSLPEFQMTGLYLDPGPDPKGYTIPLFNSDSGFVYSCFSAIAHVLNIRWSEAHEMFSDQQYDGSDPSITMVVARIRQFIKEKKNVEAAS